MSRKWVVCAVIVLALAVCVLFGGALLRYAVVMPDASYNLSLSWEGEATPSDWVYDQKGWRVYTDAGELTADGFGGFSGAVEPGDTFYFSRVLREDLDSPTLLLNAYSDAVAVFLDDTLLYTDQPGQGDAIGALALTQLDWYRDTPVTVELPRDYLGKTLTIAQSAHEPAWQSEHEYLVYPCAVTVYCGWSYESSLISEGFQVAIPAALCFAGGVLLLAAFIVSLSRRQTDYAPLAAAFLLFFSMLIILRMPSFSARYYDTSVLDRAGMERVLILPVLLLFLATQAGKRYRKLFWALALFELALCALSLGVTVFGSEIMSIAAIYLFINLPHLVSFVALTAAIVLGWVSWRRENLFYAIFTPLASAGFAAAIGYGLLTNYQMLRTQLAVIFTSVLPGYYFAWILLCDCTVMAIVSIVVMVIRREVRYQAEVRQQKEHQKLALQAYESMRLQNEQIMMLRHDMAKHLTALRQITDEAQRTAYLDDLIGQNERIHAVVQSGNQMLDIILNGKLSGVMDAGIRVEVERCAAPESLPLSDAHLCSLVMNLVDNAVAAASAPGVKAPYILLDLHMAGGFFVFTLENAVAAGAKKEPVPGHGFGLNIVRQIMAQYGDLLRVEETSESYRVTLAIPLSASQVVQ